ncbi:hypothetical protein [Rhizobium sp. BK176]|uniref:hypothetical protein n=1 Tax=Rhizobium sp. BK176 TaxID=2587071 RepID=UPI00216800A6|nr:hypothetical protein [Rhizobium sp. BK176]MCS4089280.1 hypothetical protein [Rhizobium sp. BK176]
MIVEMPFFQKFTGRSPNRSDIREMVSYDKDLMDLAEFSLSDFDQGAELGEGIGTLVRDGRHWAYFGTGVTGCLDSRPVDAERRATAMRELSKIIDPTRFFDNGRMKLQINRLMSEPPQSRWIESTERQNILARLREWVGENVAVIDGHLAIRVGEPSLRLMVTQRNKRSKECSLWIERGNLLPDLARHPQGLHFPISDKDTICEVARIAVAKNPHVEWGGILIDEKEIDRMAVGFPTDESMHERTLRSLAAGVVVGGVRGPNGWAIQHHLDYLDTLNDMPTGQTDDSILDQMMNSLVVISRYVTPSTSTLVAMAVERWEDRPVAAISMCGLPRRVIP